MDVSNEGVFERDEVERKLICELRARHGTCTPKRWSGKPGFERKNRRGKKQCKEDDAVDELWLAESEELITRMGDFTVSQRQRVVAFHDRLYPSQETDIYIDR